MSPQTTSLLRLIKRILNFDTRKVIFSILLTLMAGALEGVGLLLLLPLLEFAKNTANPIATTKSKIVAQVFQFIHFHGSLIEILIIYFVTVSLVAILNYTKNRFNGILRLQFTCALQQDLYTAFICSPWLTIAKTKRSNLQHLLTRETSIAASGINTSTQLLNAGVFTAIYLVISSFISWRITLWATFFGGIIYILLHYQAKIAHRLGKSCYSFFQKLYSTINEHLGNTKLAKTYGLENQLKQHFQTVTEDIVQQGTNFIALQASNSLFYTIGSAFLFSVIFYYAISKLHIALTVLVVLLLIFVRLASKLSSLQQLYQSLLNSLPSFQAVEDALARFSLSNLVSSISTSTSLQLEQAITLKNVSFAYDTEHAPIFSNLNCIIPAKQIIAVMGASGAGKSTLIDLILGLLLPAAGEILLDNVQLRQQILVWQKSIAYVPQDDILFNDTIRNNLLWVHYSASQVEIDTALQKANIYDVVQRLPKKLETLVGDNGIGLSGGERQRLLLARALLRKPTLLVLDEATNALDQNNETLVFAALRELRKEMTIIIISHRPTVFDVADKVLLMQAGKLQELK